MGKGPPTTSLAEGPTEGHPHPAEASHVVGFYFMYWIFSVEYVYFIYMKYEMFLTYVFFGSPLSLLWCLFCVMGKGSSTTGSVMVAPEQLRFGDRMPCSSLGDIRNMQPPPPIDFTATSRWSGWHCYHQFPCPPKSPTCIYEVSLKFPFSWLLL